MQLKLEFKMCTHNSSSLGPAHDLNLPLNICAGTARSSVDLGNRKLNFLAKCSFPLLPSFIHYYRPLGDFFDADAFPWVSPPLVPRPPPVLKTWTQWCPSYRWNNSQLPSSALCWKIVIRRLTSFITLYKAGIPQYKHKAACPFRY